MSGGLSPSARELYLASLAPEEELAARRAAEKTGIPDNDPTWLLLSEVRRACRETARCTTDLTQAVANAGTRIERAGGGLATNDDAFRSLLATAVATALTEDDRVIAAVNGAAGAIEKDALRTMRALEVAIRDFMRRRGYAPFASLVFAFTLGITTSCFSLWATYHAAISYGQDLGYRAGFHDARIYDRSHP